MGPGGPQPYLERAPSKTFRDLIVWRHSHQFTLAVYQMTSAFPSARCASVSVAANIAEGFKPRGLPDKARFLNIAQASLEECRYYLIVAQDLHYAETDPAMLLLEEVSKYLEGYVHRILNSVFSESIQHQIHHHPRHAHIHPDRERPLGYRPMPRHVHAQAAPQRDDG
jgi:four helix bundle protein